MEGDDGVSGQMWIVRTKFEAEQLCNFILQESEANRERVYTIGKGSRTARQNNAIWGFSSRLAEEMNARGITVAAVAQVIEDRIEVDWDKDSVKVNLWNPIQAAIYKKNSSTKLNVDEVRIVAASVERCVASAFDIEIAFGGEGLE